MPPLGGRCRRAPTVVGRVAAGLRSLNTTLVCSGRRRVLRKPGHARNTRAASTATHGATREPGCLPCPRVHIAEIWAGTTRSTTTHRDSRNTGRRMTQFVPGPRRRRRYPVHPVGTVVRCLPPSLCRPAGCHEEPASARCWRRNRAARCGR